MLCFFVLVLYFQDFLYNTLIIFKIISSVQSLSHVQLFATPRTAARQASSSITNSQSLLKLMSIESVMPSNHLLLCHPLLLPPSIFLSIRVFSRNHFFASGGQSIGVSASASVLPMNTQDWSPSYVWEDAKVWAQRNRCLDIHLSPGGSEVKASASNAGDLGLISGSGRSLGEGNGNPLQYSCRRIPRTEEPGGL